MSDVATIFLTIASTAVGSAVSWFSRVGTTADRGPTSKPRCISLWEIIKRHSRP
jgi:hypothetical protein